MTRGKGPSKSPEDLAESPTSLPASTFKMAAPRSADKIPQRQMNDPSPLKKMPERGMANPYLGMGDEAQKVIVEIQIPKGRGPDSAREHAASFNIESFKLDRGFAPISLGSSSDRGSELTRQGNEVFELRGTIDRSKLKELERQEGVVGVWLDSKTIPVLRAFGG